MFDELANGKVVSNSLKAKYFGYLEVIHLGNIQVTNNK